MRKQNKGRDREGESDEPALQGRSHSAGLQQHKALPLSAVLAPQHVPQLALAVPPHPGPLCLAPTSCTARAQRAPLTSLHSQRHLSPLMWGKEHMSAPPGEFLRKQDGRAKLSAAQAPVKRPHLPAKCPLTSQWVQPAQATHQPQSRTDCAPRALLRSLQKGGKEGRLTIHLGRGEGVISVRVAPAALEAAALPARALQHVDDLAAVDVPQRRVQVLNCRGKVLSANQALGGA